MLIAGRFLHFDQTSRAVVERGVHTERISGCYDVLQRSCIAWMDALAVQLFLGGFRFCRVCRDGSGLID